MAEADIMLAAIKVDVEGTHEVEILDGKFENLSKTFRNSKQPIGDVTKEQKKLEEQLNRTKKSTMDQSVKNIEFLAVTEAATSGLNQLVSSQYKRIDSQLASGEITMEEAEKERLVWKAREEVNASLEKWIALIRLAKVAQIMSTAAIGLATKATNLNTKAVMKNTVAMMKNPWVLITVLVITLVVWIVKLANEGKLLADQFDWLTEKTKGLNDSLMGCLELVEDLVGLNFTESSWFDALTYEGSG